MDNRASTQSGIKLKSVDTCRVKKLRQKRRVSNLWTIECKIPSTSKKNKIKKLRDILKSRTVFLMMNHKIDEILPLFAYKFNRSTSLRKKFGRGVFNIPSLHFIIIF